MGFWDGSHCLKSLVICDCNRSQIARFGALRFPLFQKEICRPTQNTAHRLRHVTKSVRDASSQSICRTEGNPLKEQRVLEEDKRATTNVQHRFVLLFLLSFLLFCSHWAKTLCFEGESPGGKILKKCEKVWESVKISETILPFGCCPLVFLWRECFSNRILFEANLRFQWRNFERHFGASKLPWLKHDFGKSCPPRE